MSMTCCRLCAGKSKYMLRAFTSSESFLIFAIIVDISFPHLSLHLVSFPVSRNSTDTLKYCAISNSLSAFGLLFPFFQSEKVGCAMPVALQTSTTFSPLEFNSSIKISYIKTLLKSCEILIFFLTFRKTYVIMYLVRKSELRKLKAIVKL